MTNPSARAIARAAAAVQKAGTEFKATLCSTTGDITPGLSADVAGRPGYSYAVMPSGGALKVKNGRVPSATGLRVWIGTDARNPSLLRVLDVDESYAGGTGAGTGSAIGAHAPQHGWLSWDTLYSQARQLMPLRLKVISGLIVGVEPSPLAVTGGWDAAPTATLDLTSFVPTAGSRWVLVYLTALGVLSGRSGPTVAILAPLPYSKIPGLLAGERALGAVSLHNGQTTISETPSTQDIVDLRFGLREGILDGLVSVSADDTAPGYLEGKLVAGTGVTLTEGSEGGNETLTISSTATPSDATTALAGIVEIEQNPPSGHPVALTIIERGKPNGIASVDTDQMLSSMYLPLIGGQATGAVTEVSRWVRAPSNPLFGGVGTASAHEPKVLIENGIFKMWWNSGFGGPAQVNYSTSPDGITWTPYGSNPVLGNGGSGYAPSIQMRGIIKADGVYYLYLGDPSNNFLRSTSTDGIAWTTPVSVLANNAYAWAIGWANSYVWQEGYTWHMILEAQVTTAVGWRLSLWSSTDGLSWTPVAHFLTSLEYGGIGSASGPWMMPVQKRNGVYHLWYHATKIAAAIPTYIFHATSTDLINWTVTNSGNPILSPTGSTPEVDQTADPCVVEWNNKSFLFFDGVDNGSNLAKIEVLTWDGTMAQLVDGAAPVGSGSVTSVASGTGLSGGPITGSGTIGLANTSVVAGSYNNANITVDAQGRLTNASDGAGAVSGGGAGQVQGIARWAADGSSTAYTLPDVAESVELVYDDGFAIDPLFITPSADGTQIVFDAAPGAGHILLALYSIAQL